MLQTVECLASCAGPRPRWQVNCTYHESLTEAKVVTRSRTASRPGRASSRPRPQEPTRTSLAGAQRRGGYRGSRMAVTMMTPADSAAACSHPGHGTAAARTSRPASVGPSDERCAGETQEAATSMRANRGQSSGPLDPRAFAAPAGRGDADPHAAAIGARHAFAYIRGAVRFAAAAVQEALAEARTGLVGESSIRRHGVLRATSSCIAARGAYV